MNSAEHMIMMQTYRVEENVTHQTAVVHSAPVAVSWPVWRCGHIPEAYGVVCFAQQMHIATQVCAHA
jgi:hypothetical protein